MQCADAALSSACLCPVSCALVAKTAERIEVPFGRRGVRPYGSGKRETVAFRRAPNEPCIIYFGNGSGS